ncbi:gelsolin-related protein of 125 kDa-like [Clytia hemisphaerica]|uniref:gelsolin-related protein of 125 kDa-like n=1 Tax=Clytia hemisphaerica TaxID=252671 RepID=UPI0034D7AF50
MAKELAEQKLKEEKIRTTESEEIVNDLRNAEHCDHKANKALLLEEQRKRSDLGKIVDQMKSRDDQTQKELASEKQKTSKLEQMVIQMKDEMEAVRKTNQASKADGISHRTDEAVEQPTPEGALGLRTDAEGNASGKQPLVVNDDLVDRVSYCSSEEGEITPTASQTSLSGETSEQDNHEEIPQEDESDNDEQHEPHEVSQSSDFYLSDDDAIGTALNRKETVVFHTSPSIPSSNDGVKDDENDVEIRKRQSGEKIINGKEQSFDEEFSDFRISESVKITPKKQPLDNAIIQNPISLPDLVLNNSVNPSDSDVSLKADSSSSESLPSSGSSSSRNKNKNKKGKKITNKHMPIYFSNNMSPGASQKGDEHSDHKMFDDKSNNKRTPKSDGIRKLISSKPCDKTQPIANQGDNVKRLTAVFSKEVIAPVATNKSFPQPSRISSIKEKFENLSC